MARPELETDGLLPPSIIRGGVSSVPTTITKLTADQTFNSTTVANVTGMSFSVVSGRHYHYKYVIVHQSDTQTSAIRLALTYPAATVDSARVGVIFATDGTGAEYQGAITISGADEVMPTQVPSANLDAIATIEGIIVPSADGTVQLQVGCELAATVITLRPGTCLFVTDMGV